jgi:predicted Zn-dependent protease
MKLLILASTLLALTAQAQDFSRNAWPSEREQPQYVLGTAQEHWAGGQMNWYYNPANQPSNLSTADVINAIQTAAARWSGMCNLTFNFMGITSAVPSLNGTFATIDRTNVIGWDLLTNDKAVYGAYTKWWYDNTHAMVDADTVINTAFTWSAKNVEAIMTHELGHAIGLNHSNVQASVMFANPYNTYAYQRTLRGDDANACAALYGASANADSNRTMNWAEQAYATLLTPSPSPSGTYSGYYYRYYSGTNSYIGTQNGHAYFMGADSIIVDEGALTNFSSQVHAAGF